jgi:galactose mutarotase-like enzyme
MAETSLFAGAGVNVLIRAGECAVTFAPELGGKIASIAVGEKELLQPPLKTPGPRTPTMTFDEADASGWDECLPSVAACTVSTAAGEAHIPDHGDLWRVEWQRQGTGNSKKGTGNGGRRPENGSVTLLGRCFSLPLELERTVTLAEKDGGWRLDLRYKLTNVGSVIVPWSWAAHPLFLAEAGDRIVLPEAIQSLLLEGSGGGRLGKRGDRVDWPVAKLAAGGTSDLRVAQAPDSGIGDKLFAGPVAATENWCVLERPSAGVRIKVSFDAGATPYLGLWICYGGWPEGVGPKQTCVAMEPATAPADSLAVSGPWSRQLSPGQEAVWSMGVEIELM